MPAANKKLAEKRADQVKLTQLRRVVITLEASEEMLGRIAALLTFATVPYDLEPAPVIGPLPWEDPNDPRFIPEKPELEVDYNLVRKDIMLAMDKYLTAGGDRQQIVAAIKDCGGTKLSDVPKDRLLDLYHILNGLNQPKGT